MTAIFQLLDVDVDAVPHCAPPNTVMIRILENSIFALFDVWFSPPELFYINNLLWAASQEKLMCSVSYCVLTMLLRFFFRVSKISTAYNNRLVSHMLIIHIVSCPHWKFIIDSVFIMSDTSSSIMSKPPRACCHLTFDRWPLNLAYQFKERSLTNDRCNVMQCTAHILVSRRLLLPLSRSSPDGALAYGALVESDRTEFESKADWFFACRTSTAV